MRILFLGLSLFLLSCNADDAAKKRPLASTPAKPVVKPLPYELIKRRIDSTRLGFRQAYAKAKDSTERNKVLADVKAFLLRVIGSELYSYWQGTPWDFNGTTTVPKEGSIACGYFVTGLLQDAGYRLNRLKLSTCPSLVTMKELTSASAVKNLSRLTFEAFDNWVKKSEKGVYVVGLSFHTGFVVNDSTDAWFIHSNYVNKTGVSKERLAESAALQASKTRYITSLTGNEKFLRTWLLH